MGKIKQTMPYVEYDPVKVPVKRDFLDTISRMLIRNNTCKCTNNDPLLERDMKEVNSFLDQEYNYYKLHDKPEPKMAIGNGYQACEEDHCD